MVRQAYIKTAGAENLLIIAGGVIPRPRSDGRFRVFDGGTGFLQEGGRAFYLDCRRSVALSPATLFQFSLDLSLTYPFGCSL